MENVIRLFRERLFASFYEWLEKNRAAIGEKWYAQLFDRAKKAEDLADNAIGIIAMSMWIFSMVTNFGVLAGMGPDGYNLQSLNPNLDEATTKRLLAIISACMNLQYLPREEAKKKIPIISSNKFSLKLFTKAGYNQNEREERKC